MGQKFKDRAKMTDRKSKDFKKKFKPNKPNKRGPENAEKTQIFKRDESYNVLNIDEKIEKLKDLPEEQVNKKIRKKLRQLEYLKKKHEQDQNTLKSLKGADEPEKTPEIEENNEMDESPASETIDNKPTKTESDKKDAMKGIKRFVVFVGNLPKLITEDDIKKHFYKVGEIKSIRIPDAKESRKSGFAFIELGDRISFEKSLSLHHTMLNNKRINVLFTNPDGTNIDMKEIKKKNAKFDAMRKAGLLVGSVAEHKKRSFRRKKKRMAEMKAAIDR